MKLLELLKKVLEDKHISNSYYVPNTVDEKRQKICWFGENVLGLVINFNGETYEWIYKIEGEPNGIALFPDNTIVNFSSAEVLLEALNSHNIHTDDDVILSDDYETDVKPYVEETNQTIKMKTTPAKAIVCYWEGPFVTLKIKDPSKSYRCRLRKEFYIDTKDECVVKSILENFDIVEVLTTLQNLRKKVK